MRLLITLLLLSNLVQAQRGIDLERQARAGDTLGSVLISGALRPNWDGNFLFDGEVVTVNGDTVAMRPDLIDQDSTNELQDLALTGDLLGLTNSDTLIDLSKYNNLWQQVGDGRIFYDTDNVGIGKNAPAYKLDVDGAGQFDRIITTVSNFTNPGVTIRGGRPNILYDFQTAGAGLASNFFKAKIQNTSTGLILQNAGAVGLYGNMTTGAGGAPETRYLYIDARNVSNNWVGATLRVDEEDRVGIGLSSVTRPEYTLDVDGEVRIQNLATGASNDFAVYNAAGVLQKRTVTIPSSFLDLNDTPNNYTGDGMYYLRVNGLENAIEFVQVGTPGSGVDTTEIYVNNIAFTNDTLVLSRVGLSPLSEPLPAFIDRDSTNELQILSIDEPTNNIYQIDLTDGGGGSIDIDETEAWTDILGRPDSLSFFVNDLVVSDFPNDANYEENVQADWNETDVNSDAHILNKPDLTQYLTDYQDLTFTNNQLGLTNSDVTHDFSLYLDNTDNQDLFQVLGEGNDAGSLEILNIAQGTASTSAARVDQIPDVTPYDNHLINDQDIIATNELQNLTFQNDSIGLTNSNIHHDLSAYKQQLSSNENAAQISISDGNTVSYRPFGAGAGSGVLDFNDISNARAGSGATLLRGSTAANAPNNSTAFWHSFGYEFGQKSGNGNITQFAIPYSRQSDIENGMFMRGRFSGTWSDWRRFWMDSDFSQLDIDNWRDAYAHIALDLDTDPTNELDNTDEQPLSDVLTRGNDADGLSIENIGLSVSPTGAARRDELQFKESDNIATNAYFGNTGNVSIGGDQDSPYKLKVEDGDFGLIDGSAFLDNSQNINFREANGIDYFPALGFEADNRTQLRGSVGVDFETSDSGSFRFSPNAGQGSFNASSRIIRLFQNDAKTVDVFSIDGDGDILTTGGITLGNRQGKGFAAGTAGTDAVNLNQLNTAIAGVDQLQTLLIVPTGTLYSWSLSDDGGTGTIDVDETETVADITDFPDNVSYFNNDVGYLTSADISPDNTFDSNRPISRIPAVGDNIGGSTVQDWLEYWYTPAYEQPDISMNVLSPNVVEVGSSTNYTVQGSTDNPCQFTLSGGTISPIGTNFNSTASYSVAYTHEPTAQGSTLFTASQSWNQSGTICETGTPVTGTTTASRRVYNEYPVLYGMSATVYDDSSIPNYAGWDKFVVRESQADDQTYNLTGTNQYIYFLVPANFDPISKIVDHNGFDVTPSFTEYNVSITSTGLENNWTASYRLYKLNNLTTANGFGYTIEL